MYMHLYLDSSCLYDSPVSIFAHAELWGGEVPVDESKRRGFDGASPLHPDQVAGQNSETSLPYQHDRFGVRCRVILASIRVQHSKEYDKIHRSSKHRVHREEASFNLL